MATIVEERMRQLITIQPEAYVSPDFLGLEKERLWPKVWQVACREEEIANVGDYTVYEVADESIIVARTKDGINAFHNVCPHRGRQIMEGCGHAINFRCPYHNWTFSLAGKNVAVQDREDWAGTLDGEQLDLSPVKTGVWGGFVWINMDAHCESLAEFLAPVPAYLDAYELENMRIRWAYELRLPCNWKVALEAFMEGYHVAATHPQILPVQGDDYTTSVAHGKHAHFGTWEPKAMVGSPSPRLKRDAPVDVRHGIVEFFQQMEDTFGAIFTDRDLEAAKQILEHLPANADPRTAFGAAIEFGRKAAEAEGCGYPANLTPEKMFAAGTDWHVFPNCVTLPYFDGAVWYRSRPDGDNPDSCIFNIYSLKRYAVGKEPGATVERVDNVEGRSFGLIVDQDIANMRKVQRGMKSRAFRYARPNPVQEVEITNFHKTLGKYLSHDQ